jgi:hypothetical protein
MKVTGLKIEPRSGTAKKTGNPWQSLFVNGTYNGKEYEGNIFPKRSNEITNPVEVEFDE